MRNARARVALSKDALSKWNVFDSNASRSRTASLNVLELSSPLRGSISTSTRQTGASDSESRRLPRTHLTPTMAWTPSQPSYNYVAEPEQFIDYPEENYGEEDDVVGQMPSPFTGASAAFPQPSTQYATYPPGNSYPPTPGYNSSFSGAVPQTAPMYGSQGWISQTSVGAISVPPTPLRGESIDKGFGQDLDRDLGPLIKKASTKVKAVLRIGGRGHRQQPSIPLLPTPLGAAYQPAPQPYFQPPPQQPYPYPTPNQNQAQGNQWPNQGYTPMPNAQAFNGSGWNSGGPGFAC